VTSCIVIGNKVFHGKLRCDKEQVSLSSWNSRHLLVFLGVQSVDTIGRCTTSLSIGNASVFVMPCFK